MFGSLPGRAETIGYGAAALYASIATYVIARWRMYLTAAAREGRNRLRGRLPSGMRWLIPSFFAGDRYLMVERIFLLVLFGLVTAIMWAGFAAGVISLLRGGG